MTNTAATYPHDRVIIDCNYCSRHGEYSRERFCEIVGADTPLPNALTVLAESVGCNEARPSATEMNGNCKPYYGNIEGKCAFAACANDEWNFWKAGIL